MPKQKTRRKKASSASIFHTWEFWLLFSVAFIIVGVLWLPIPGLAPISVIFCFALLMGLSRFGYITDEWDAEDERFLLVIIITSWVILLLLGVVTIALLPWWKVLFAGLLFDAEFLVLLAVVYKVKVSPLFFLARLIGFEREVTIPIKTKAYGQIDIKRKIGGKQLGSFVVTAFAVLIVFKVVGMPWAGFMALIALFLSILPIPLPLNTITFVAIKLFVSWFL